MKKKGQVIDKVWKRRDGPGMGGYVSESLLLKLLFSQ